MLDKEKLEKYFFDVFVEAWNERCDSGWEYPNGTERIKFLRRKHERERQKRI
jgi:hypothetical protein